MKKHSFCIFTLLLAVAAMACSHKPQPADDEEAVATAADYAARLGLGWNLGNQFDSYNDGVSSETAWGNKPVGRAIFDSVAAAGFTHVRIPVTWLGHVGPAPDYRIDSAWLDRVARAVDYAEQAGLCAILNIHHDGADSAHWLDIKGAAADSARNAEVSAQLAAMWTQIATRFADKGDFLMFEAFNEIHDGGWGWGNNRRDGGRQYATHNGWLQTFVDAVRATGGNNATRFLGIPGYCTNPELTIENLVLPADTAADRLLVAVHFYDPTDFAINATYTEWGHTGDPSKKASWGDEDNITGTLDKLADKYVSNGVGVYLGECGATTRSTDRAEAFRLYYTEYLFKAAADRGIAAIVWDNGSAGTGKEAFGFFNHTTGNYITPKAKTAVETMVKAFFTTDPAYTLDSVYDGAPE